MGVRHQARRLHQLNAVTAPHANKIYCSHLSNFACLRQTNMLFTPLETNEDLVGFSLLFRNDLVPSARFALGVCLLEGTFHLSPFNIRC